MPTSLPTSDALNTAEHIARQAGALLRYYFERPRTFDHKQTRVDLVTEADRASEQLIVEALQKAFPQHHIVGEEGGGYGLPASETPYHWYVDPLDGTTNFAHRFPVFAVSLALSGPDMQPLLGVVYDPMRDEVFKAQRGHGATLNGRPLQVSGVENLSEALVVTGFPYNRWTAEDNNVPLFGHFARRVQGVRRVGAAALDLCWVAAGRFDVYWEHGLQPWDGQAGMLCVVEAGGTVTDYDGEVSEAMWRGQTVVATNGLLHAQALDVIQHGDAAPRPVALGEPESTGV